MKGLKDLSHPSWDGRVDDWLSHIPPSLASPVLSAEELVRASNAPGGPTKAIDLHKKTIPLVPALRERTFSDSLFLREKALHCLRTGSQLLCAGHSTWSAIAMYEAAFFSTKAFVYLMGIKDVSRSDALYFEIFYSESKKGIKNFDGHLAFNLKDRMTHEVLWKMLPRLASTIKGSAPRLLTYEIRRNDFDQFTKERNSLIYDSQSWSRDPQALNGDLTCPLAYLDNFLFMNTSGAIEAEYVDKYYRTAQAMLNIVDEFLSKIALNAPAVRAHLLNSPGPAAVLSASFS